MQTIRDRCHVEVPRVILSESPGIRRAFAKQPDARNQGGVLYAHFEDAVYADTKGNKDPVEEACYAIRYRVQTLKVATCVVWRQLKFIRISLFTDSVHIESQKEAAASNAAH
ncbi:hypothetical protein CLF_107340 [Clonorchis sinensis]|uniref:Uncharacterized protein n=1 Tax=Clonorchis sinensis TaxID=79923 RepID=G7YGM2_CLOSI|nr:hypothetical protein CLF_107340 [Clonorchis sinensis]